MKITFINPKLSRQRNSNAGLFLLSFVLLGMATMSCTKSTSSGEEFKVDVKTVEGVILSPNKNPISGAVIIVKDATTGTVTDVDGKFILDLQKFKEEIVTLKISMIDYESTEVVVKTNKLPTDLGKITLKKEAP